MQNASDFPSWPTFPSGLAGEWVDSDQVFRTDVMPYEEPDPMILALMRSDRQAREDWTCEEAHARMTRKQQGAVAMRVRGYTQEETAVELGVNQANISRRLQRSGECLVPIIEQNSIF